MSATKSPPSRPNLFVAELRSFLFPLLARWSQPDVGAAKWAVAEPALLGHLTQCAGKLLECAGRTSADRDVAIPLCLDLVEFTWINQDPHVRRCSVSGRRCSGGWRWRFCMNLMMCAEKWCRESWHVWNSTVPRLTPHQQEPRHRRELPSGTNVEQQEAASGKACEPRITVETLLHVEVQPCLWKRFDSGMIALCWYTGPRVLH